MRKKLRRTLVGLAGLVLAGFILLNFLAYNHAHAMMHFSVGGPRTAKPESLSFPARLRVLFTGVNLPRPVSSLSPSALAADARALTIPGAGAITLAAWYCDRGPTSPLVILFHGYGAEKTSMLQEAKAFLALSASVLLVDFRGSGGSSEAYTTIGIDEADDVTAAIAFARENIPHRATVLFGQSMGAAAILRAVAVDGIAPDAVILEAVFDTMLNTVRNRFALMHVPSFPAAQALVFWGGRQAGFNGFAHRPMDDARALTCPALFLHGAHDPRARLADARRVFDAVPAARKQFIVFAGAAHEAYLTRDPAQWRAAVAPYLE